MSETAAQISAPAAPAEADSNAIRVTESAARQIRKVAAAEGNPALALRISVSGGGCSGFQYGFTLDETETGDDVVIDRDGARLLIDTVSLEYLRGSQIDFVEDLTGAYFRISNPQATSSCGCGNSFSM